MDYKFWIGLSVNAVGVYLAYRQVRILQREVGAGRSRPKSDRAQGIGRYWPILIMTGLVALAWAPYVVEVVKPRAVVNVDGVESHVRMWLDRFGLSVGTVSDDLPDAIFAIQGTAKNGRKVLVARTRGLDQYLTLQTVVGLSPEHKEAYGQLTTVQKGQFVRRVMAQMSGAGSDVSLQSDPFLLAVSLRLPITPDLTEHLFMSAVDRAFIAQAQALSLVGLELEEARVR